MSKPKDEPTGWAFRSRRAFWTRQDLSLGAKAVAHLLLACTNNEGYAWPTTPQLSKWGKVNGQTVDKYLAELKAAGAVSWDIWKDEFGHKRRRFNLKAIRVKKSNYDPLGGAGFDRNASEQWREYDGVENTRRP